MTDEIIEKGEIRIDHFIPWKFMKTETTKEAHPISNCLNRKLTERDKREFFNLVKNIIKKHGLVLGTFALVINIPDEFRIYITLPKEGNNLF